MRFNSIIISLLFTSLFFGCAKELPEVEHQSIQDNIFEISKLVNSKATLFLTDKGKSLKSKVSEVYAINAYSLKAVDTIEASNKLRPLFKDLELYLPEDISKIDVRFKITENQLVAYTSYDQSTVKLSSLSSAKEPAQNIFQFSILGHGIKRRAKNANNEETRNIEFHQTPKNEATHVKINAISTSRIMGDLSSLDMEQKRELFIKSELNDKLLSRKIIRTLLNDSSILESSKITNMSFSDESEFILKTFKNETYIYSVIKKQDLIKKEKQALKNSIKIKSILNSKEKGEFLRAEYKFTTTPVIKEYKKDVDGKTLALIELNTPLELQRADIVKININSLTDTRSELFNAFPDLKKKPLIKKSKIDLDSEYVFLPSTHGTPRKVKDATAFFQGTERIVKLKMTSSGLSVYQQESDSRFQDNELNDSPILKIEGRHVDYDCLEKENGTCADGVEESNHEDWKKRRFFAPNLDRFRHYQVNTIDLFNLGSSCFSKVSSKVSHYKFKEGVINVEQEVTFNVSKSFGCIAKYFYDDNLESTSFKMKFFYSLVRLKDLASKDYEPVAYPVKDQDTFGFFKNESKVLDQDYSSSRSKKSYLLNRFNPKKKEVIYELSEEFAREENRYILDATKEVVSNLNKSLKKAQAGIQIKLNEPKKVYPGDLRKNSIVLITDPLANGLLGYGPSVSNPRTGEILQAHTNMYLGVLRQTTRSTYKFMENMSKETPVTFAKSSNATASQGSTFAPIVSSHGVSDMVSKSKNEITQAMAKLSATTISTNNNKLSTKDSILLINSNKEEVDLHDHSDHDFHELEKQVNGHREDLNILAKNNAFHKEFLSYNTLGKKILKEIREDKRFFNEDGTLISWETLDKDLKEVAIKLIITQAYKTTLAHELGHNLGLRHNFKGSYDKKNFYTQSDINSDVAPQYSSIMDYGLSQLNELPILGKYDIAALRFGYGRKVEKTSGQIIDVDQTLENTISTLPPKSLREFDFCTDENAGSNLTCNRFDEGTNLVDIIKSSINQYEQSYQYANMRDGRENFRSYGIDNYIRYRAYTLNKFRQMLKTWATYHSIFIQSSPTLMYTGCPKAQEAVVPFCVTINDTVSATKLAAEHLLKILVTPDKTCAVADINDPARKITQLLPLRTVYDKIIFATKDSVINSCFHADIKAELRNQGLVPVAEGGKYLNDVKGSHPEHRYQSDIMIRGMWADKMLALKFLFGRRSDSTSANLGSYSFFDHEEIKKHLVRYINHLTLGFPLNNAIPFKDENGNDVKVQYSVGGLDIIPEQPTWLPTIVFGVPAFSGEVFNKLQLNMIAKENYSTDPIQKYSSKELENLFSVAEFGLEDTNTVESMPESKTDFLFSEEEEKYFVAKSSNKFAKKMIRVINESEFLKGFSPTKSQEIYAKKVTPRPDSTWSPEMKAVFSFEMKMGLEFAKQVTEALDSGKTFTKNELINMGLPPQVADGILAMQGLKKEERAEIIKALITPLPPEVPAGTCPKEAKLYSLDVLTLELHAYGILEQKIQEYKVKLNWLPKQGKQIDFIRSLRY